MELMDRSATRGLSTKAQLFVHHGAFGSDVLRSCKEPVAHDVLMA